MRLPLLNPTRGYAVGPVRRASLVPARLGAVVLAAGLAATAWSADSAAGSVLVHRTMMPDSGPSSFAVALTPSLGFSYDPGRGGVNYVWQGEFVDLGPTWKAKINHPAEVRGTIVYRESVRFPLRLGDGNREPAYVFKGYVLLPDGVEFHYLLDGVPVREEIRATPDGRGLVRRFRVDTPVAAWSYALEPQPGVTVASAQGNWNEARTAVVGRGGREFTLEINLSPGQP